MKNLLILLSHLLFPTSFNRHDFDLDKTQFPIEINHLKEKYQNKEKKYYYRVFANELVQEDGKDSCFSKNYVKN